MSYSIILFIKRGSKAKGKSNKAAVSRMHVGYLLRDWTKVFYHPSDDDFAADMENMPPVYVASGSQCRPREGEIAWLPHFDPKHIQTSKPKDRDPIHKKTLYDAYRYLDEDDEEMVEDLETELDDPNHRRWQTWFDEAKKWKTGRLNNRRKRRQRNKRADAGSDTSDDSAYESEGERRGPPQGMPMPPPPRPAKRKHLPPLNPRGSQEKDPKQRKVQSLSGNPKTPLNQLPPRGTPSGPNGPRPPFWYDSASPTPDATMMSGTRTDHLPGSFLRQPRARSASVIDGISQHDLNDGMSDDWDPTPPDGAPADPSDEAAPQPQSENDWVNPGGYQNEEDEDTALNRALRESMPPETRPPLTPRPTGMEAVRLTVEDDMDEDQALEAALQASLAESQPPRISAERVTDDNGFNSQNGLNGLNGENELMGLNELNGENGENGLDRRNDMNGDNSE